MNIDDLTYGDMKKIAALFSGGNHAKNDPTRPSIADSMIGQYVIVRSRNEGINAGYVEMADETGVVLKDARRLWLHKPANSNLSWYEGVALSGVSDDSKISAAVDRKVIMEDYSITLCTNSAADSIRKAASHAPA
jgi:hypothetical protein